MFEAKNTILFDLDGTLIDSVPDLALAINAMLEERGKKPFKEATIRGWVGNGSAMLVRRALVGDQASPPPIDPELFRDAHERFLSHYARLLAHATRPYPEVIETLAKLQERGYLLAIVTNKPGPFVGPILERLGMKDFFALSVGGEDLPVKKPDPAPLLYACEKLHRSKEETVMVGDSINDMQAAQGAGISSILVSYGYHHQMPLEQIPADKRIDRFGELLDFFRKERR